MQVSIDISLYPLTVAYKQPVLDFIAELKKSSFTIIETPLTTQIYGDYDAVMSFLTSQIKDVFLDETKYVFTLKIVKGNRAHKNVN